MYRQVNPAQPRGKWRWLPWLLVAAYICFIFSNSILDGNSSGEVSGSLSEVLYGFLQKIGLSMSFDSFHGLIRKMAHFSEYAVLGILLRIVTRQMQTRRKWLLRSVFLLAVPLVDETIQLFVPGRGGSLFDCGIDMAGYLFGMLVASFIAWVFFGRRRGRISSV